MERKLKRERNLVRKEGKGETPTARERSGGTKLSAVAAALSCLRFVARRANGMTIMMAGWFEVSSLSGRLGCVGLLSDRLGGPKLVVRELVGMLEKER